MKFLPSLNGSHPGRTGRIVIMKISNESEELLEMLWAIMIERQQDTCGVSELKGKGNLEELHIAGCIEIQNERIVLTAKGKKEAASCVRRHRLAERLLVDVLDQKKNGVHEKGCQFEHLLQQGLAENICTLLGHPKTCPHGRPIPEGRCCRDMRGMPRKVIMSLADMKKGEKGSISYLQVEDREALQKLIAIGALPKTEIKLLQRFPSYVFRIGKKTQFAIDRDLASQIYVRIQEKDQAE